MFNSITPFGGISPELTRAVQHQAPALAGILAFSLLGLLCYIAVFTEPKNPIAMGQFFAALRDRKTAHAWALTPRWLITLVLNFVALIATLVLLRDGRLGVDFLTVSDGLLLSAFLFTVRNIGIVLWFNFLPGAQRGDLAAFVVIFVLSGIVPFIFAGAGASSLMALVSPWGSMSGGAWIAIPAAVESVVVYFLVIRAWRAGEKLRLQSS